MVKVIERLVDPENVCSALDWILKASENPSKSLEPEFDIISSERRFAKKIRKLSQNDPQFWEGWLERNQVFRLARSMLAKPKIIKHAAFIKRHYDESYIPLHQDFALWERPYKTAITLWVALTRSVRENGGMFYFPDDGTIFKHELNLKYPMFKCISEEEPRVEPSRFVDLNLQSGDVAIWGAGTAHGSYSNSTGELRVGMPMVFIEEEEFNGFH